MEHGTSKLQTILSIKSVAIRGDRGRNRGFGPLKTPNDFSFSTIDWGLISVFFILAPSQLEPRDAGPLCERICVVSIQSIQLELSSQHVLCFTYSLEFVEESKISIIASRLLSVLILRVTGIDVKDALHL